MIEALNSFGEMLARHGLPIVVCAAGLMVLFMLVRTIWMPRLASRAELTTLREKAEFEREQQSKNNEIQHARRMHEIQEEQQLEALELTKITREAVKSIKDTESAIARPLKELIEAHHDWKVGSQFQTVTLGQAAINAIDILHARGQLEDAEHQRIRAILNQGLPIADKIADKVEDSSG